VNLGQVERLKRYQFVGDGIVQDAVDAFARVVVLLVVQEFTSSPSRKVLNRPQESNNVLTVLVRRFCRLPLAGT
jgi:hypothetical protein